MLCLPQPTTKLFIDGKFVESKSNEWIDILNPVSEAGFLFVLKKDCIVDNIKKYFL